MAPRDKTPPTAKKASVKKTPAKKAPAKASAAKTSLAKKAPAKKAPAKASSAKKAPAKKAPAKASLAKKAPAKKAPAKASSTKKAPAKASSTKKAPAKEAPANASAGKKAPAKEAPAKHAMAKTVLAKRGAAKDARAKQGSAQRPSVKKATKARIAPVGAQTPAGSSATAGKKARDGGKEPRLARPASPPPPPRDPTLDKPLITRRATSLPLKLKAKAVAQKGKGKAKVKATAAPPPPPPAPRTKTLEERMQDAERRLLDTPEAFRRAYGHRLNMSWIYHDAALEGTVYTREELDLALYPGASATTTDANLEPICEEIRRHLEAIAWVREAAIGAVKPPITVDTLRKIFLILHPEEGELKLVRYRRDVPQHRLYFHEYALPEKIPAKLRAIVDWVNSPETQKSRSMLRLAARAHYDIIRVFPFQVDSGKVARLFMNLLLMRGGLPPAILHSADRQKYYEALKSSPATVNQLVQEAIDNAIASVERMLDENQTKTRSFG